MAHSDRVVPLTCKEGVVVSMRAWIAANRDGRSPYVVEPPDERALLPPVQVPHIEGRIKAATKNVGSLMP